MKEVGCNQAFQKATYTIEVLLYADYNFLHHYVSQNPDKILITEVNTQYQDLKLILFLIKKRMTNVFVLFLVLRLMLYTEYIPVVDTDTGESILLTDVVYVIMYYGKCVNIK